MISPDKTHLPHYQVNVCGGSFDTVRTRFSGWKNEPLVYRQEQHMFEGKENVQALGNEVYDDTDAARHALQRACHPQDDFALAAFVHDDGRELWLVMAAYDE